MTPSYHMERTRESETRDPNWGTSAMVQARDMMFRPRGEVEDVERQPRVRGPVWGTLATLDV